MLTPEIRLPAFESQICQTSVKLHIIILFHINVFISGDPPVGKSVGVPADDPFKDQRLYALLLQSPVCL
jgi:hypothetical protein